MFGKKKNKKFLNRAESSVDSYAKVSGGDTAIEKSSLTNMNDQVEKKAEPSGVIDHSVIHNGAIIVTGWESLGAGIDWIEFEGKRFLAREIDASMIRYERQDILGLDLVSNKTSRHGFILHCDIKILKLPLNVGQSISCQLGFNSGVVLTQKKLIIKSVATAREEGVFANFSDPKEVADFKALLGENSSLVIDHLGASVSGNIFIENSLWLAEKVVFINGWAEDASISSLVCEAIDGPSYPRVKAHFRRRNDVHDHLEKLTGKTIVNSVEHGFSCFVFLPEELNFPERLRIAFVDSDKKKTKASMVISRGEVASYKENIDAMLSIASEGLLVPSAEVADAFSLMNNRYINMQSNLVQEVIAYTEQEEGSQRPRVSIIVPFYKEAFFVHHLVQMQKCAPAYVEWVWVCDDPDLVEPLRAALFNKSQMIKQQTKLVILKKNIGFSMANNIGYKYASGDYTLLMNSDIFCHDFDWLDYSLALFDQQNNIGAIGYSLKFEDETIQHEGMQFLRDKNYNNHYLTVHPNKGLPAKYKTLTHRRVTACTAALLLIANDDFSDKIFSTDYVLGDFEDSHLNMELIKNGKEILLVETPAIYHLERQSIKLLGDSAARSKITLLNCQIFNQQWSEILDVREVQS